MFLCATQQKLTESDSLAQMCSEVPFASPLFGGSPQWQNPKGGMKSRFRQFVPNPVGTPTPTRKSMYTSVRTNTVAQANSHMYT